MSLNTNLQRFLESLKSDITTKDTLDRASHQSSFAQTVVETGAKKGFSFTIQDVKTAISQALGGSRELSDAELEAVAGADGGDCPLGSLGGGSNIC